MSLIRDINSFKETHNVSEFGEWTLKTDCNESELVSKEVSFDGYVRKDGLFVPTEMIIKQTHSSGVTFISRRELELNEEAIKLFNGTHPDYKNDRATDIVSNWERK